MAGIDPRVLLDLEDYERFKLWGICVEFTNKNYWRARFISGPHKNKAVGRIIMNTPEHLECDHENGNSLDFRKGNLRNATRRQNSFNRGTPKKESKLPKGVRIKGNMYQANIMFMGSTVCLGCYSTAEEASTAYEKSAKFYFGEFYVGNNRAPSIKFNEV